MSHSRAPPSRSRYSIRERDELINETPADPLNEDTSVLALFDALIEEDEDGSDLSLTSSDNDDDDNDSDDFYLMEDERCLRHVMRVFPPFFGHGFRLFSDDDDSDATPTDSELSCANTSSLEPPWSMDEDLWSNESNMEGQDEELWEMYASDVAAWGSSDSEPSLSDDEEKQSGRIIGIYGGGEAGGRDKNKDKETGGGSSSAAGVKKERTRKIVGPSGSQTSGEPACGSGCGSSRSGTQPQPTRRCQPSRKAKKTTATSASSSKENTKKTTAASASARSSTVAEKKRRESSFAAGGSSQLKPKKDEGTSSSKSGTSKRYQPKRKVKSSSACLSAATGHGSNVVGACAMNSEPLASSSSSSMANPKRNGSGSRTVANGNGSESSGRGSRAVADGNGETSSSGPSQRWTRKRNRRQQEANGTAADSYEQYRAEDFLKAKSPKSFYAKKKDPP